MNIEQATAWKCTKCGAYYISKQSAELCCVKPKKVCEDCGIELDPKWYHTVCNSCGEKRRYNRCRKMTIEEYEKEFPDYMVIVGDDDYYSSIDEALDYCSGNEDEIPHYVYGTEKVFVKVNIDSAIENALYDAYEDAQFNNIDELYKFVEEWNERNKLTMFTEAKIVIDIPDDLRKEYIQ